MVYVNLEGKWGLTTPLMGLSHTRSYYENLYMIEDVYLHGLVITVCFMQSNHQITELYNKSVSPAKKVVLLF